MGRVRGGGAGGRVGWGGMGFDGRGRYGVERWVAVYDGMSL